MLEPDTPACGWCDDDCGLESVERHGVAYCSEDHARCGRWVDRGQPMGERLGRLAVRVRRGLLRSLRRYEEIEARRDLSARLEEVIDVLRRRGPEAAHRAAAAELQLWALGTSTAWQAVVWGEAEEYMRRAAEDAGAAGIEPEAAESRRLTTIPTEPPLVGIGQEQAG